MTSVPDRANRSTTPLDVPANGQTPSAPSRAVAKPGDVFIFDDGAQVDPLVGSGSEILAARGEPTEIVAPTGVGKTTVMIALESAMLGISKPDFLGYPVAQVDKILYLALDRPKQIARAHRRCYGEEHRDILHDRLLVWDQPLPFNPNTEPEQYGPWLQSLGVNVVFEDSLKDMFKALNKDEGGWNVNAAHQSAVVAGVDVMAAHHQRKAQAENRKPTAIDDVYGSGWITAGAGSVILLWGKPGDPVVELSHLKQPASEIGPLTVAIDHERGTFSLVEGTDLLAIVRASTGITAADAAKRLYATTTPSRAEGERARRKLDALVQRGHVHAPDAGFVRGSVRAPRRYFPVEARLV